MGVANFKNWRKKMKKIFFLKKNFLKRKTLINGNKKNILGRDQKWVWPKMGVANFEKNEKIWRKKTNLKHFFFKRKTLINGNKKIYFGVWPKMGVAKNGRGKLWKKWKNMTKNLFLF